MPLGFRPIQTSQARLRFDIDAMTTTELILAGLVTAFAIIGWAKVISDSRERRPPKR
jgi:hypothetical protein